MHQMPMTRSENMSRVRATENSVEILLRKELLRRGYRYRKNDKTVFGKPDIVFKGKRVAVFCDSKFWHGKEYLREGKLPKTNTEFWRNKLISNIKRDELVNKTLRKDSWIVIRLYDNGIFQRV